MCQTIDCIKKDAKRDYVPAIITNNFYAPALVSCNPKPINYSQVKSGRFVKPNIIYSVSNPQQK